MPKHLKYVQMKSDFVTVSKIGKVTAYCKIYTKFFSTR